MKLSFLNLPEQRRHRAIDEAATRRETLAVIVEKDFWVCWMLGVIFESPFAKDVVFKGGTSLSKVFGVINRFSKHRSVTFSSVPQVASGWCQSKSGAQVDGAGRVGLF